MNTFTAKELIAYKEIVNIQKSVGIFMKMENIQLEIRDSILINNITSPQMVVRQIESLVSYSMEFDEKTGECIENLRFGTDDRLRLFYRMSSEMLASYMHELFPLFGVVGFGTLPVLNSHTLKQGKYIVLHALSKTREFNFSNQNLFTHQSNPKIYFNCFSDKEGFYWIVLKRKSGSEFEFETPFSGKIEQCTFMQELTKQALQKQRIHLLYT